MCTLEKQMILFTKNSEVEKNIESYVKCGKIYVHLW